MHVSPRSLEDEAFADHVIGALHGHGVPADRLAVEITETAAVTNHAAALRLIRRLATAGCEMVLDDFGAGLSSVVHLNDLPLAA